MPSDHIHLTADPTPDGEQIRGPMRVSLAVSFLMLAGKMAAYFLTGSAAVLSDAAESVVHLVAVGFASFSASLALRPAEQQSPYGYERIAFFSAGFEGAMILLAAAWIILESVRKLIEGAVPERVAFGALLTLAASLANLALGWYLVKRGRAAQSLILEANGKHVLTDSWTSFGVVAGLLLVWLTGWAPLDPLVAILVALNILWTAGSLLRTSIRGLMDLPDPAQGTVLHSAVEEAGRALGVSPHRIRFRNTGNRVIMSVHLLFPYAEKLGDAHRRATEFEMKIAELVPFPVEVLTHLEAQEDHAELHPTETSLAAARSEADSRRSKPAHR